MIIGKGQTERISRDEQNGTEEIRISEVSEQSELARR